MSVVLGLLVAACFGSGDFLGGLASRRSVTTAVLVLSQACALLLAVPYAFGFDADPTSRDLWYGAAAGALNIVGLAALYQGLATGRMGVVAPITAMGAAVIPIAWGLGIGERPTTIALVGVGLAVLAGGLIGRERDIDGNSTMSALGWSTLASVGFGTSFIFFSETSIDAGFWPVLTARVAAAPLVVAAAVVVRNQWLPARADRWKAVGAGVLDVTATALLLVALRRELLTLVAPIASLAPAFTVMLAWRYLHESIGRIQRWGIACALVGLALIGAG